MFNSRSRTQSPLPAEPYYPQTSRTDLFGNLREQFGMLDGGNEFVRDLRKQPSRAESLNGAGLMKLSVNHDL